MAIKPLWVLAGHVLVNRRDQFDLKDPQTVASLDRGIQVVWARLKAAGSFALKDQMDMVEKREINPFRRFVFLSIKIPIILDPVSRECHLEDEALSAIWATYKPEDVDVPDGIKKIKQWLLDPENETILAKTTDYCAIHHQGLRKLPPLLDRFSQLSTIDFSDNWLAVIPECLTRLPLLTDLNLMNNKVRVIPDFIGELTKLQSLNLSRNQIREVPCSLDKLVCLENFSVYSNLIHWIPDGLSRLTSLTSFNAGTNRLTSVPFFVRNIVSLKYLTLDKNSIATVPEFLGNLTQLKTLFLGGNQISKVSSCLGTLTRLRTLDLTDNHLEEIPEVVADLRLKNLYLEGNRIRRIPDVPEKVVERFEFLVFFAEDLDQLDGLGIHNNPLLCVFDSKTVGARTPQELLRIAELFNHYRPVSSLACFYQSLAFCDTIDQQAFFDLKPEDRTLIAEMRGMDFFDDVPLFAHAVRKAVAAKYERLPQGRITESTDNVLALIDAMDAIPLLLTHASNI